MVRNSAIGSVTHCALGIQAERILSVTRLVNLLSYCQGARLEPPDEMIKQKNKLALLGLCATLAFLGACSSNTTTEQAAKTKGPGQESSSPAGTDAKKVDKALVRFLNATAEEKNLSFGDASVFQNIAYKKVTRYLEVPAERHEFKVFGGAQTAQPLATDSEGLTAGKHYTVIASTDKNHKVDLVTVNDDLAAPPAGQAKVRVINTVPGLDADLYTPAKKSALISGTGYNHASSYEEIDPATTALAVRHGMSKKNSVPVKDVKLEAGKLYTIVVLGGGPNKLSAETIEDQLAGPAAGTQAP